MVVTCCRNCGSILVLLAELLVGQLLTSTQATERSTLLVIVGVVVVRADCVVWNPFCVVSGGVDRFDLRMEDVIETADIERVARTIGFEIIVG